MKLKDLPTKYDFNSVEKGKYRRWIKEGYFTAGDENKKPYTIVIPPPNITGKLHIGHVLNTTLQDILVRRKECKDTTSYIFRGWITPVLRRKPGLNPI